MPGSDDGGGPDAHDEAQGATAPADRDSTASATAPADGTQPSMQRVRPDEPAGMLLSRARVLGALFGDQSAHGRFGRFRVLERLGAGGMGVVYAAYDPDLDRGVALKLITVSFKERGAALAEAKALARLSHPNVVPIYDVGIEGDHVYLVMELVRGKTLRHWIEGQRPRAILGAYQQAGAALAAAHGAGLVHRDFKPDNAIVGADGRVRVVDFGLACEADDPAQAAERRPAAGTPHFMAPEIAAGAAVTAAADQYSFCVALSDALATAPGDPPPRRIAAVLERGRAGDPQARFASMTDLLRALARDPARTRRRVAALAGLVAVTSGIAFFAGSQRPQARDEHAICDAGDAELAGAWSPAARAAALARVAMLGVYGETLQPQLARDLDVHATRWVTAYHRACVDQRRGAQSDTLSDRRAVCLQRGKDAFARLGELVAAAQPANLADLERAAQSLPDPALCADIAALTSDVAPPPPWLAASAARLRTQLARARVDLDAGRYAEARDAATAAVATARALDYQPVLAEALLLEGHAQGQMQDTDEDRAAAVPILAEAYAVAMRARADSLAVEAWARRVWALGTTTDPDRALASIDVIQPLAERAPSATFARALLYNNIGNVELAREHRGDARLAFASALRESAGYTGDGALELIAIRSNLGLVTDDHAEGDKLIAEAEAERTARLGKLHPDTLVNAWQRGTVTIDDLAQALAVLTEACRGDELHTTLVESTASCWNEVGQLHWELGERELAIEAMGRARRASPTAASTSTPYQALWRGDASAALRQFGDLVAENARTPSKLWWDRRARAVLLLGLGQAQRQSGRLPAARLSLEAAVAELAPIAAAHPSAFNERRLGRAQIELALTLASIGAGERALAPITAAARSWLRKVHSPSRELEALMARHQR